MKILFASQNKNKYLEMSDLFLEHSKTHELVMANKDLNVIEDKETIDENAKKKALEYFEFFKMPVISDDSGLFIEALNGAPGVYSARYAGESSTHEQNIEKVLELLKNENNRNAKFQTVLCFYDGSEFLYSHGELEGSITYQPRGSNGFGYDPIFEVRNSTLAEMSRDQKSEISHRKNASVNMIELLNEI